MFLRGIYFIDFKDREESRIPHPFYPCWRISTHRKTRKRTASTADGKHFYRTKAVFLLAGASKRAARGQPSRVARENALPAAPGAGKVVRQGHADEHEKRE